MATTINMPPGTVFAYAGTLESVRAIDRGGFALLCDGRSVTRQDHGELFDAIGSSWGGDGADLFNLPDLRGLFLRGVDHSFNANAARKENSRAQDPGPRRALHAGGHGGDSPPNIVGSYEDDLVGPHDHTMESNQSAGADTDGYDADRGLRGTSRGNIHTSTFAGAESRPVNAAVWYLIVAKQA